MNFANVLPNYLLNKSKCWHSGILGSILKECISELIVPPAPVPHSVHLHFPFCSSFTCIQVRLILQPSPCCLDSSRKALRAHYRASVPSDLEPGITAARKSTAGKVLLKPCRYNAHKMLLPASNKPLLNMCK